VTVEELIVLLQRMPQKATVKCWPYDGQGRASDIHEVRHVEDAEVPDAPFVVIED
jgi:hypothetical protein